MLLLLKRSSKNTNIFTLCTFQYFGMENPHVALYVPPQAPLWAPVTRCHHRLVPPLAVLEPSAVPCMTHTVQLVPFFRLVGRLPLCFISQHLIKIKSVFALSEDAHPPTSTISSILMSFVIIDEGWIELSKLLKCKLKRWQSEKHDRLRRVQISWSVLFIHSFFFLLVAASMLRWHAGLFRLLLLCGLLKIVWGGIEMGGWWEWVCTVSRRDLSFFKYFLCTALGFLLTFSVHVVVELKSQAFYDGT